MNEDKKKAAAITAVLYYLQSEEEAIACQQLEQAPYNHQQAEPAMWGYSGRHYQMMMRNLIQLKNFPGLKA